MMGLGGGKRRATDQILFACLALSCARPPAPTSKGPAATDELEAWERGEVDIPDRASCKYCPTGECEAAYGYEGTLRCARYREPPPTN